MLISILILTLITLVVLGFSGIFKFLIFSKSKSVKSFDFIYGIIFLTTISLISNLFIPLKKISFITCLVGLFFFVLFFFNKKNNINIIKILFLNIFILFICYGNELVYDSGLYHLQTIKYNYEYKTIFGLSNLEPRLGMNSSFHSLISIFNFPIFGYNVIYFFNIVIYSFFINLVIDKSFREEKTAYYTLSFSLVFIFLYSYLHPWKNGTILNNIGSPEVDTIAMIFFIISFVLFLAFLDSRDNKYFNLLLCCTMITLTIKLSYLSVSLFIIYAFLISKKIKIFSKLNFFLLFSFLLWLIKNITLTGCLLFPIKQTCYNFIWALGPNNVENYNNIIRSFNRTMPNHLKFSDFDYTLNSYEWIFPWIKNYFVKTEFLIISSIMIIGSIFFIVFIKTIEFMKHKKFIYNYNYFIIFLILLFSIFVWLQSPEIRFGYGSIISLATFLLTISFLNLKKFIIKNSQFSNLLIIIFFIMIIDNLENSKLLMKNPFIREFDYSKINLLYLTNNYKVYRPNDGVFCNFFPGFCSYQSFDVNITRKNNYIYIINNWQ